jgi:hypothetical protein
VAQLGLVRRMNAHAHHGDFAMQVLAVAIIVIAGVVVWQRRRLEAWAATRPPPKPSKHLWLAIPIGMVGAIVIALAIGASTGVFAWPAIRRAYIAIVIIASVVSAPFAFLLVRRQQHWDSTRRFRFALTMTVVAALFALLSLVFNHL